VSVLLPTDDVSLYLPSGADTHGWAGTDSAPFWTGTGALQLGPGPSDPHSAEAGGHGPHDPNWERTGVLYLPDDAGLEQLADGCAADIRGNVWVLAQTRFVPDPLGGYAGCWVATCTQTDMWGQ
jgi:hypothetical protein